MVFRLACAASLMLAACAHIVPSTAARLAAVDPLTADPAGLAVVVVLPPGLKVSPGSAKLELGAVRGDERLSGSFQLQDRPAPAGVAVAEGASARAFALSATDAERMRALQDQIAGWKREGNAEGSFGIGLGACATGAGPAPDATGSILIRVASDGPFMPLVSDGRLSDLLGAKVLAAIKPCQGAE